ncbi:MAG: thiamine pyrophosphate-binding protein [Chloroflexi bacterium]|nr:thiamine pyrophosphate-binding protein [Chloroflexota bacterium]
MAGPEYGSDIIVDMMRAYGIKYAPTNLGGTFRGLLDSIVNYGGNKDPEIIECLHEETAVCIAHGYSNVSGKPAVALVHNVVGTLHGTMGIYDAYVARAPVIVMSGTGPMRLADRRPRIDWVHTALIQGNLVRDYVKWDDQPWDAASFPESFARAYRIAMTEPMGPVYIALDAGWQEPPLPERVEIPDVSKYAPLGKMQGDPALVRQVAEWIANAELPLIVAGRMGKTEAGFRGLIELAELAHIPVDDSGTELSFPNTHPLDATGTGLVDRADVIVTLEVDNLEPVFQARTGRYPRGTGVPRLAAQAKLVSVGVGDLQVSQTTTDFGRLYPVDLAIGGDPNLVVAQLTAELRRILAENPALRDRFGGRDRRLADACTATRTRWQETARHQADERPISLSRLAQETWDAVKGDNFIVSADPGGGWVRRLWTLDQPSQVAGTEGAGAQGSWLPKAIGAGLAARDQGAFVVHFNGDGDFLYGPTAVWSAAHHHIPMLLILLNNGGYQGEGGHLVCAAEQRERSTANRHICVDITNPDCDFAQLVRAQGGYAESRVANPDDLGPAIQRAVKAMHEQQTFALVDVRCG